MMVSTSSKSIVRIDYKRCHICGRCLARQVCKVRAIVHFDDGEPPYVDMFRCYGCMVCIKECPFEAVVIAN